MENKLAYGGDTIKSEEHWGHAMDKIIQVVSSGNLSQTTWRIFFR